MARSIVDVLSPRKSDIAQTPQPPMTEAERIELEEWRRQRWVKSALDSLLLLAKYDDGVATELCNRVADFAGPDAKLGPMMLARLRVDRAGKKRASKWAPWKLAFLLNHYYLARLCGGKHKAAAAKVARLVGTESAELTKKLLPRANKEVPDEAVWPDVLEHLRAIGKRPPLRTKRGAKKG